LVITQAYARLKVIVLEIIAREHTLSPAKNEDSIDDVFCMRSKDGSSVPSAPSTWRETLTRVPYGVFQADETYRREQERSFRGPIWHFLCREVEISNDGDFKTTSVGDTPVVVARDYDREIYAFENRCAHRGALICLENHGKGRKDFSCVYHAWTYSTK
jgi:nitrite reductase/ring-hydroxylating ferredoxin subunit